ncbi:MAG: carboxylesterase [Gammaproteobacteria bacterium]|nr:carboxylesterase [Gammaproteobacteria bacterium]
MFELLPTVEVETGHPPAASIIWLHGLGADGHDFEPIVPQLAGALLQPTRFVFPHAPVRPVTINGGMAMRAWFDIFGIDRQIRQDEAGIRASADCAAELIRRENERGVPSARIVLAGFSQGGAVALHAGLRHPDRLAGIMGLSTALPVSHTLAEEATAANARTPILLAHGSLDAVLPFALGTASRDALAALGYAVTWHEYVMPHAVNPEEIADIACWLAKVLG